MNEQERTTILRVEHAHRILEALVNKPALFYEVLRGAHGLKICGPWEENSLGHWIRKAPDGSSNGQVYFGRMSRPTSWYYTVGHISPTECSGSEVGKYLVDEYLKKHGWILP